MKAACSLYALSDFLSFWKMGAWWGMEIAELFVAQAEVTDWHSVAGIHTLRAYESPKYLSKWKMTLLVLLHALHCPISFPSSEVWICRTEAVSGVSQLGQLNEESEAREQPSAQGHPTCERWCLDLLTLRPRLVVSAWHHHPCLRDHCPERYSLSLSVGLPKGVV